MPHLTEEEELFLQRIAARGPRQFEPAPIQRGILGLLENVAAFLGQNIGAAGAVATEALGLAPPGGLAERIGQRPGESFVFPSGVEAFLGFDPQQTGLARRVAGRTLPIEFDPSRGINTAFAATLEATAGQGSVERFREQYPILAPALFGAVRIGLDPLTLTGAGSGARALAIARGARGFIPFGRTFGVRAGGLEGAALALREGGASETAVRNFLRASLPPDPGFLRRLAFVETPRDFFRRGTIFQRNLDPALTIFGRGAKDLARGDVLATATEEAARQDLLGSVAGGIQARIRSTAERIGLARPAAATVRADVAGVEEVIRAARQNKILPSIEGIQTRAGVDADEARRIQADILALLRADDIAAPPPVTGRAAFQADFPARAPEQFVPPSGEIFTPLELEREVGRVAERFFVRGRPGAAPTPAPSIIDRLMAARTKPGLPPTRKQIKEVLTTATGRPITDRQVTSAREIIRASLAGRPPRLAVSEGARARLAESLRGITASARGEIAATNLRRAAPGATIRNVPELSPSDFVVTLPNQKSIVVDAAAVIERPPGGFLAGRGRALRPGEEIAGKTVIYTAEGKPLMESSGFVQIVPGAGPEVFSDEFFHVADEMKQFSPAERASLQGRFAKGLTQADQITEAIAQGVGEWMGKRARQTAPQDRVLERIYQFFLGLYEDLFGVTASGTLRRFERGEVFARPAGGVAEQVGQVERFAIRKTVPIVPLTPEIAAAKAHTQGINELAEGSAVRLWRTVRQFAADLLGPESRGVSFGERWKRAMDGPIGEMWQRNVTRIIGDDLTFVSTAINDMPDPVFLEAVFRTLKGHAGKLRAIIKNGIPVPGRVGAFIGPKGSLVDRLMAHIPALAKRRGVQVSEAFAVEGMDATQNYMNALRVKGEAAAMDDALTGVQAVMRGEEAAFQRITLQRLFEKDRFTNVNADRAFSDLEDFLALDQRTPGQVQDWSQWLGQRATAWKADGISGMNAGSGKTEVEFADLLLAQYEPVADILAQGARQYRQIADEALQYRVLKGSMSPADLAAIRESKDGFYVSWQRAIEEDGFSLPIAGGDPVKAFKGSQKEFQNAYASLFELVDKQIKYADRHEFLSLFTEGIVDVRIGRQLDSVPTRGFAKNQFIVIRNGVKESWEFNDDITQALRGVHVNDEFGFLSKLAAVPALVTRWTVTHDPGFLARNVIRDALDRMVKSDTDAGLRGLFRTFTGDELTNATMAGLDQSVGWYGKGGKQNYQKFLATQIRRASRRGDTQIATMDWITDKASSIFSGSEMVGRMAEFKNQYELLIRSGRTPYQASIIAANKARDLLDFATAGTAIRKINRYVAFLNPAVQGTRAMIRFARRSPAAFMRRWSTYVLGPAIANYAWNQATGNAQEYLDQPAYLRDFFYNFKVGPNIWLRIPKPFELGVFASSAERFVDATVRIADGQDPVKAFEQAFEGNPGNLVKGLSPVDEGAFAGPFRPVLEIMANFDFFRQRNIIPEYEKNLALPLRKGQKNASRIARLIGNVLPMDARNIDQLIFSFGGGVARFGVGLTKDRPVTAAAILRGTGLIVPSPGFGGIATQRAQRLAQERGLSRSRIFRPVSEQLRRVFQATTSEQIQREKDRLRQVSREAERRLERISIRELIRRQNQR